MNQPKRCSTPILIARWIARVGSIGSIGLLLLFFIGEEFNPAAIAVEEWLGLLFFPLGISVGMALGWWREEWGAAITAASLLGFYAIQWLLGGFPGSPVFIFFGAPGLLFLLPWLLSRRTEG